MQIHLVKAELFYAGWRTGGWTDGRIDSRRTDMHIYEANSRFSQFFELA